MEESPPVDSMIEIPPSDEIKICEYILRFHYVDNITLLSNMQLQWELD